MPRDWEDPGGWPERALADVRAELVGDGTTVGFDYDQAKEKIEHKIPEDVKGHYLELLAKQKSAKK